MKQRIKHYARAVVRGGMSRREFMGRTAALGVSATAASALLGSAVHAEGPKKGGHLKMGLGGGESSNSLDPALTLSQAPYNVLAQIGETLLQVDFDGGLEHRIAEEFSSTPDAKVWSFKIRKGIKFHDGSDLTAEDVMRTMQRHSDEKATSGALGLMKGIEEMRAEGDVFEVTLDEPNADLPYLLTDPHLRIQPGGGFDDPAGGIFSGPYRIVVNEPGVRHMMERFEDYWDDSRGHFDSTEVLIINDVTARVSALQSGQVDMANLISPRLADLLDRAPGMVLERTQGRGQNVFVMMVDQAPFDNNDLRLALKHALDREEMVEKILRGYGTVGNDIPVNATYPLFDGSLPQREFDLDKAAEYYKKSGHDGSPIVLRCSDVAFPGAVDAAQLFQQSARKAGIPLELRREPGDGYWSEVWNKRPFCASYWTGRPTQDQMYATAYLSTADWNDTRFSNEKFDNLLKEARATLDDAKRTEMYNEMSMIVRDEGGLIMPMFNDFLDARSERIAGWKPHPNADMMDNSAAVFCWMA
ncbi:ABC transporter substrate-binding protein [Pontibaca methylaminivorans]|uniref:Peptide/nickel transport system substrate-binding protein n=1 Tax=Pontibaca methylaminivorans TaxID=515897 RepID=A0A1R3WLB1_9RHOB|nr:ABC transporter substrate-binding protein [Pontibaca methylaminivorans]SIT78602.1 peptide/nickel transport system substrate-binding protein [Pontibaca methylaminivorans]